MAGGSKAPAHSLLDSALIPVEELAAFSAREGSRPRQIYGAHRWFARRFGTAMRALLVAAATPNTADFWEAYYGRDGGDLTGMHVLDPFVGGGTILYEAQRLGASVTGVDVDPVACAVSRFEFGAAEASDPTDLIDILWRAAGKDLAARYRTVVNGEDRIGLHYFWVQDIDCGGCGEHFAGHPNHRLGDHPKTCWTICPHCEAVQEQPLDRKTVACGCGRRARVDTGAVTAGVATCPHCQHTESLIENARRCGRPRWRLAAIESIPARHGRRVPIAERVFAAPSPLDLELIDDATAALDDVAGLVPRRRIAAKGRSDSRLHDYGYRRYSELFNNRQLLHLVTTAHAIAKLAPDDRQAAGLALSNHTVSNNMLTTYTARWRQVTPLFAVRSFRHSARPIELNPWLDGPGRGTFPNALRRVAAAVSFAKDPQEYTTDGFERVPAKAAGPAHVINADSRALSQIPDASVDLVVTDPPYFDNIAYSELAEFFIPWLAAVGLTGRRSGALRDSLATSGRSAECAADFAAGLSDCLREAARALKAGGRIVFTFQHTSPAAWGALADAIGAAGLRAVTVFPMKGDGDRGLHNHEGSTTWDAVFVLRAGTELRPDASVGRRQMAALEEHTATWAERLGLGAADRAMQRRAAMVAGSAGFLRAAGRDTQIALDQAMAGGSSQ